MTLMVNPHKPDIDELLKARLREALAVDLDGDALDTAVEELSELAEKQAERLQEAYLARKRKEMHGDDYHMCCNLCYPTWEYVCSFGVYQLWREGPVEGLGHYYLMCEPGHRDDYLMRFRSIPTPDPIPWEDEEALEDDPDNPLWVESCDWVDVVEKDVSFTEERPVTHAEFVTDMVTLGYDFDGDLEFWVTDQLGRIIAAKNEEQANGVQGA